MMQTLENKSKPKLTTRNITSLAIMAALSIVLVYMVRIPMFLPFLEYDPADIPIFITAFAFGPVAGLILTVIVSVLQGLTVSASSGIIGIVMHILATGSFVLVAGNIYRRSKTRKNAIVALITGVGVWTVMMILWNIIITPIFMNVPREQVLTLIVPAILPFNLVKAGINATITFVLYKSVGKLFCVPETPAVKNKRCTREA
ncbi:MAG: ECF transporter S component [Christensenella sp.]|uniref:ECF transporter S component n=1 Tax=Christensenella sp. TaxID=1935934 RepID=UPI002B1FA4E3|nr:ECF transporter S component [Christensenella sp.]MEA5004236.1 ECF transporter S component [Christensenella sp.]